MSFTTYVIDELLSVPIGKTCCRKAMLCGMLYASVESGASGLSVSFRAKTAAEVCAVWAGFPVWVASRVCRAVCPLWAVEAAVAGTEFNP